MRQCPECRGAMAEDLQVTVKGAMYGLKITRKKRGFFNNATAEPKAAVCSNCGPVAFYVENPDDFRE
jgi:predicted nucleic-acid-binding Zn-ribbon protein